MADTNHIKNVAIVGAGGNSGKYMVEALLKTGRHTVTALTRGGSTSKIPEGVHVKTIDYDNQSSIVEALQGQQVLLVTMGVSAPPDQETKLFKAAAEAGVLFVLPNEWGLDTANEALNAGTMLGGQKVKRRQEIEELGKSSWISVITGFWYEWSLSIPFAYGFDFEKRAITFFDDGETKICTSTWPQVGRTVASLLSLPIESEGKGASLNDYKNSFCYVNSFTVSQNDMLESVLRVTGTKIQDWTISKEPTEERYAKGKELMRGDNRYLGFGICLYTRDFFPDGAGDFETSKGLVNAALGLPKEDIDEATARAIERQKMNPNGYGRGR